MMPHIQQKQTRYTDTTDVNTATWKFHGMISIREIVCPHTLWGHFTYTDYPTLVIDLEYGLVITPALNHRNITYSYATW